MVEWGRWKGVSQINRFRGDNKLPIKAKQSKAKQSKAKFNGITGAMAGLDTL